MPSSTEQAKSPEIQCPNPKQTVNIGVGLDVVADDIHYLILSELSKASSDAISSFAQTSKVLREAALPFVYRDLVLRAGTTTSNAKRAYETFVDTFRSEESDLVAKHIRNLTVKDEIPEKDLMLIFNKISEHGRLRKLSWETAAHMPTAVFDKLHATWPDLDLAVRLLDRQKVKKKEHRQIDMKLLSSPLLKTLIYTIYNQGYRAETPSRSEWPKLTRALVAGGSVRKLCIQSQSDGSSYRGVKIIDGSEPEKLTRLDISPSDRLPALEELTINVEANWSGTTYLWDTEHCELLRDSMDWSQLRKLSFGEDFPGAFFQTFTGLLPSVRSLRFGTAGTTSGVHAKNFIRSLIDLESLDIGRAESSINEVWPSILMHKDTLKELLLRPDPVYVDLNRLETIAKTFSVLERIGWDVPLQNKLLDTKHLSILSSMNLKQLDLFVYLPGGSTDFSAELRQNAMGTISPPPIDVAASKKAIIALIEKFSEGRERPLKRVTLHLARTGYEDRAQPYMMQGKLQVRRSEGSQDQLIEAKYEMRGQGVWHGSRVLEDELEMEED